MTSKENAIVTCLMGRGRDKLSTEEIEQVAKTLGVTTRSVYRYLEKIGRAKCVAKGEIPLTIRFKKTLPDAVIPTRAHLTDAGFDLTAVSMEVDEVKEIVTYHTGIAIELPKGYVGLVFPRSSIYKVQLDLSNGVGVVDSGFRGEITLKFRICKPHIRRYGVGERVGQLIIMPYPEIKFEEVKELSEGERGENGYGSTGK